MIRRKLKQPIITDSELNKIEKYNKDIKSGYRPWVTVRQSHTHGQGHIVHSAKTGREHHLLSRGERLPFFMFERDSSVIDILEQYPLPINETMKLAVKHNILHPGAYKERKKHDNKIPAKTMTTDLVVIKKKPSGQIILQPYSFKYAGALDVIDQDIRKYNRTKSKLRLEEKFWETQTNKLVILTEQDFSRTEIYNLEFFRECYDYPEYTRVSDEFRYIIYLNICRHFLEYPTFTLKQHLASLAQELNIEFLQIFYVFQKLVYENILILDLTHRIELYRPVRLYSKVRNYAA